MSDSLSISTEQVSVMVIKKKKKLEDITVNQRDPDLMAEDHQSWLIWWLVENRPQGMIQWWYVIDDLGDGNKISVSALEDAEDYLNGSWDIISRNYKTLGGISGYGNYFVVVMQIAGRFGEWSQGRQVGREEREELMNRMVQGYKDETIGIEVDFQFFLENEGWYLAEVPREDNAVRLFYRGTNYSKSDMVVKVTEDLMPSPYRTIESANDTMTHNDLDTDTIRFLTESDSWVLPTKVLGTLNWSRFPTVFLE